MSCDRTENDEAAFMGFPMLVNALVLYLSGVASSYEGQGSGDLRHLCSPFWSHPNGNDPY